MNIIIIITLIPSVIDKDNIQSYNVCSSLMKDKDNLIDNTVNLLLSREVKHNCMIFHFLFAVTLIFNVSVLIEAGITSKSGEFVSLNSITFFQKREMSMTRLKFREHNIDKFIDISCSEKN